MTYGPMLAPVVALVAWTLVMQIWMYATRLPAMRRKGIELKGRRGGRGAQLDGVLEDEVQWKAHNYNHLLEQPTLFYAIAISLALLGGGAWQLNVILAWNEAFWTLNLSSSAAAPLTTFIASYSSPEGLFWAKLSAASTLAIAPILILGWFSQKQLVRGLTFGAVK